MRSASRGGHGHGHGHSDYEGGHSEHGGHAQESEELGHEASAIPTPTPPPPPPLIGEGVPDERDVYAWRLHANAQRPSR